MKKDERLKLEQRIVLVEEKIDKILDYITQVSKKVTMINEISQIKTELDAVQNELKDTNIRVLDIQDRVYDLRADLMDVKVRALDTQDRIYDVIGNVSEIKERAHDTQDQTYNIINQNKTYDKQNKIFFWSLYKRTDEDFDSAKARFFLDLPKEKGAMAIKQSLTLLLFKELNDVCKSNNIAYWVDFGTLLGAKRHGGYIPWDDDVDLGMLRSDIERLKIAVAKHPHIKIMQEYAVNINVCNLVRVVFKNLNCPCFVDIFIYDNCLRCDKEAWKIHVLERKKLVKECLQYKNKKDEQTSYSKELDAAARNIVENVERKEKIRARIEKANEILAEKIGLTNHESEGIIWGIDNFSLKKGVRMFKRTEIFPLQEISFEGMTCLAPNSMDKILEDRYGDIYELPDDMISHEHLKMKKNEVDDLAFIYEKIQQELGGI